MGVSENSGTRQIIHFYRVFHYKPSILGYPYFWKHPFGAATIGFLSTNEFSGKAQRREGNWPAVRDTQILRSSQHVEQTTGCPKYRERVCDKPMKY